jgi:GNAT superfamily N-acetyltransferase
MKTKFLNLAFMYAITLSIQTAQGSALEPLTFKSISTDKTAILKLKNRQLLKMSPCTNMEALSAEAEVLKQAFPDIDIRYCLKNYSWAHAQIVTDQGPIIVSAVLYYPEKDNQTFISKIAVHPEHQGKGIGQALITYLAALTECDSIGLCSKKSALSFYKKFGFVSLNPKDTIDLVKYFAPPLSLIPTPPPTE